MKPLRGLWHYLDQINDDDIYDIPPWELASPFVNFKIHSTQKSETLESDYKQRFNEITDFYENMQFRSVYTDGSKSNLMITFLSQQFHLLIF